MYQSYEFTFAGKSSRMFGLMVCDVAGKRHGDHAFGNKANIVETRIPERVSPIQYGVRYHDEPLSFRLIFGAEKEMNRYELQEIARWLTGHREYQWLTIDQPDLNNVRFRCLIRSLTPVSVGWYPVAFEADVVCDCSYAYGYLKRARLTASGEGAAVIRNDGTAWESAKPKFMISTEGGTELSILNQTTGVEMKFTGLPAAGTNFIVDCENKIIEDEPKEFDLYNGFNFNFIEFVPGANKVLVRGDAIIIMEWTCYFNVGA